MEPNLFGITPEDIEQFELEPEDSSDVELDLLLELEELAAKYAHSLQDEGWQDRAEIVARLPGLDNKIKTACIFLGFPQILSQVFFVHAVAQGQLLPENAIMMFTMYCSAVGIPKHEISAWIAFYFSLGVFQQDNAVSTVAELEAASVVAGPMTTVMSVGSADNLSATLTTMGAMQPFLEELGIIFEEDPTLLQIYNDKIVPIEELAPDA